MLRVIAAGWRAHAALEASGGVARAVARLSRSIYAEAAGELVWIGERHAALHPRAVLVDAAVPAGAHPVADVAGVVPWRPPPLPAGGTTRAAARLRAFVPGAGEPRGLVRLLVCNAAGDDVLARHARPHVAALARAAAADDAEAFARAARPLLGLGPGLTPSGDDLIGGALFARRALLGEDARWDAAVTDIGADAALRTHPISARLLIDLAAGEGWAPLHDLVAALVTGMGDAAGALRRLTALGQTSGWDLVAGLLIGARAASAVPETAGTTS